VNWQLHLWPKYAGIGKTIYGPGLREADALHAEKVLQAKLRRRGWKESDLAQWVLTAVRAILEALPKRDAEVPRPPGQPSREEVNLYTGTAARALALAEKGGSKGSKRKDGDRERAGRVHSREEE